MGTPATPGGIGGSPGGGLLHKLNPIKTPPTRARVRIATAMCTARAAWSGWGRGSL